MSIKPEYVNKIFNGSKKYEYRKIKCKNKPNKIIVYSSSPIKKIVGELIVEEIIYDKKEVIWENTNMYGGIEKNKYDEYFKNKEFAVAYKIKKYIKYDIPKELKDYNICNPPQSYVYIK
jgi:predicted transcriptional regulator